MGEVKRSKSMEKEDAKYMNLKLLHNHVEPTHLMCQCVCLKLFPRRCSSERLSIWGKDFLLLPLVLHNLGETQ